MSNTKENSNTIESSNTRSMEKHKILRMAGIGLLIVLGVIALTVLITVGVMISGGKSLRIKGLGKPKLEVVSQTSQGVELPEGVEWQDDWIHYDGRVYQYNDNIMSFLVLGIDQKGEVEENQEFAMGGQSDAIFLVILNPDKKDIDILGINRDTMTTVTCYGMEIDGMVPEVEAQITTQYGFGDGMELSCERTRDVVSKLLYDLPIHGYVSMKMDAVAVLNDAVGGVKLKVLEDLTFFSKKWKKGKKVTLIGQDAYSYIRVRDITKFESARGRLNRQKQYLQEYVKQAKKKIKEDITLPVTLYQELSKYLVTDISIDEIAYLANEVKDYDFNKKSIHTLKGDTVRGEKHEEFYPDKTALKETMIKLFYEEVDLE